MKARRLDEVLDECLSAHLEGRRSIEESLSLYPALRHELEPLLRTAAELAGALDRSPLPLPLERGREQFLVRASARRAAADLRPRRRFARAVFGSARWAVVAGGFAAAAIGVAILTVPLFDSSPAGESPRAEFLPADSLGPAVNDLRRAQQQLWMRANRGDSVSPQMIRNLARTTSELESRVRNFSALDGPSRLALRRAINEQFLLLLLIVDTQPPDVTPEAIEALDLTEEIAEAWGVELPEVPLNETATPPLSSPGETPAPSPTPAPSSTDAPTPPPEATPTPQPTPPAGS